MHATSDLISTQFNIIFPIFEKWYTELYIIAKCSQEIKCSVSLPHGTFGRQYVIVTFSSYTPFLANIVF